MLNPSDTVVLSMDFQNEIVRNFVPTDDGLLTRAASVLAAARAAGIPVVHVVVQFRPGHPEVAAHGMFKMVRDGNRLVEGTEAAAIHPAVAPVAAELVVTKKRIGAFTGSDLDVILRSLGRRHLVLMGVATSGVVLSTVRAAVDLDFTMHVVADCCADRDAEVHRVLTEKVFAQMAPAITADAFVEAVREG